MQDRKGYLKKRLQLGDSAKLDDRVRMYINPECVLAEDGLVFDSACLLEDRSIQTALNADRVCKLSYKEKSASIILDFGREIHGGLEFSVQTIEGEEQVSLRIRFGESVSEAMSELGGSTHASNDHAMRDFIIQVRQLSMNPVGETGFRFVKIDLLTPNTSICLRTVKAVMLYRDIPYLGSFECSDPLLNRIWNTGAYTVHLNMQHFIWDGIKRDRLVWMGDLHPEIMTIQTVFGNQKIIRDSLDFVVAETPFEQWINGMPSYSMWWIIIQHDYFMQFGNKAYLKSQLPYMKHVCKMLSAYIREDGKDITPETRFIDWPTMNDKSAVDIGLQALHVLTVKCAMRLFKIFDERKSFELCRKDYERLIKWRIDMVNSKQSNALAVIAGLLDAKEANEKSLKVAGAAGLSTFMGYYILEARAMAGDTKGALDTIREYWGGMLKLGATTFWEDFDVRWLKNAAPIDRLPRLGEIDVHASCGMYCYQGFRHSFCHGWAGSVTAWLTKYILGIKVIEPGCKKLCIKPNLCGLEWVHGTYPTTKGILDVEHFAGGSGEVKTIIRAPEGVEVVNG